MPLPNTSLSHSFAPVYGRSIWKSPTAKLLDRAFGKICCRCSDRLHISLVAHCFNYIVTGLSKGFVMYCIWRELVPVSLVADLQSIHEVCQGNASSTAITTMLLTQVTRDQQRLQSHYSAVYCRSCSTRRAACTHTTDLVNCTRLLSHISQ